MATMNAMPNESRLVSRPRAFSRAACALLLAAGVATSLHTLVQAQGGVGQNINVVTGSSDQFKGDEFRQRQNESVIGISSINPSHMLVAYNDYRTVDFVDPLPDLPPTLLQRVVSRFVAWLRAPFRRGHEAEEEEEKGEAEEKAVIAAAQAWIGLSFSDDAGRNWYTGLLPGRWVPAPADVESWDDTNQLAALDAASDPVLAATHDQFFVGGIAFTPNGNSAGFVSRFTDRNDTEAGANIHFDGTQVLLSQPARYFVDKPTVAAAPGAPGGKAYVYASFVVFDTQDPQGLSSIVQLYRSTNSGETWTGPQTLSQRFTRNQAPFILIDPNSPLTIYLGWRVFSSRTGGPTNAIVLMKSTDGGASFTPPVPRALAMPLKAFDQPQVSTNLATSVLPIPRANAYPSAVIDGNGAIHVAIQEYVNASTGEPLTPGQDGSSGIPRVTITSSYNGGTTWTQRRAADFSPGSGTQFMPALAAVGEPGPSCAGQSGPRSRVMLMYYDARASGAGMAPGTPGWVQGAGAQFDVRLAEASACNRDARGRLVFGASQQMSQYERSSQKPHSILDIPGWQGIPAVNRGYTMFCGGNCGFVGDYMGLTPRVPYVLTGAGWRLTTSAAVDSSLLPSPVVAGAWADAREVVLPASPATVPGTFFFERLPWWNYQPPGTGNTPPACLNPGSRDQNIFAAEYTPGWLYASAPETFRPSNVPRTYPLVVENRGGSVRLAHLTIDAAANASFDYASFDPENPSPPANDGEADIAIGPDSTVTGSITIGPGQQLPVRISVQEIAGDGTPVAGGARTTVLLLAAGGQEPTPVEKHAPEFLDDPIVTKPFPDGTFPVNVTNATPFTQNPFTQNPFSQNPFSQNPFTQNPFTQNPFSQNPFTQNPFSQNAASGTIYDVTDTNFIVRMGSASTHAAAFTALLSIRNALALKGSYLFQVFVSRTSGQPALDGCTSFDGARSVQVSSIITPFSQNPFTQNPFSQNPFSQNPFSQNPFTQNPFTQNPFTQNPFSQNTTPTDPDTLYVDPFNRDPVVSTSTFHLFPTTGLVGPVDSYRGSRGVDTVVYTLRAFQIRSSTAPDFVPFFEEVGGEIIPIDLGVTVVAQTPNVLEDGGGGFIFDPDGPSSASTGAGVPVQLAFVAQPAATLVGNTITPVPRVAIQDSFGTTVAGATLPVTIALGANPGGATLAGTLTRMAVNGVATFNDLTLDAVASGYTLAASSAGLAGAESVPFAIGGAIPFEAQAKLLAGDGLAGDNFGLRVGISGDGIVVGSLNSDTLGSNAGAAYVYRKLLGGWTQETKLLASGGSAGDLFGSGVAISGDTVVVGAQGRNGGEGGAYVFRKTGGVWSQEATLHSLVSLGATAAFGSAVALQGDTAVVGAQSTVMGTGRAFVFRRAGSVWSLDEELMTSDTAAGDFFGASVAISGDAVVVGAYGDAGQAGSAYVFREVAGNWMEEDKLVASDATAGDWFGYSASIAGDVVAVGAVLDNSALTATGSAYVFRKTGGVWSQEAKLVSDTPSSFDEFGFGVALSGNTLVVGSEEDDAGAPDAGAVFVFRYTGGTWVQDDVVTAFDANNADLLGIAVALEGGTLVAGAWGDDDNGSQSGSAYVFTSGPSSTNGVTFQQQPTNTPATVVISPAVQVRVADATDAVLPGVSVTISLVGPGTLSGTLTRITGPTGIAVFDDLSVNLAGNGLQLRATVTMVAPEDSAFFDVTP